MEKNLQLGYDIGITNIPQQKEVFMKISKSETRSSIKTLPEIRYEDQQLSSFSGLVIFQKLFQAIDLKERLRRCFSHLKSSSTFGLHNIAFLLVVHMIIGWRRLADVQYYKDDPMVLRALGLKRLPHVSVISRSLKEMDDRCVEKVGDLSCGIVRDRLHQESFSILTFDFDGSVVSTLSGKTEGTAVGFNKKKKGARSYYPLLATVAQTGQVYRIRNRSGNVHDSNGARAFIAEVLNEARMEFPYTRLESRLDSAHFNEDTCFWMNQSGIEFTISVPFERFSELKGFIESRKRWRRVNKDWSFFEMDWRPRKWNKNFRFIFYRQKAHKQRKGPIQLDLFVPLDTRYDYKVVVTNKTVKAKAVLFFHNGRGSQETIFGDMKTDCPLDYIPTRRRVGNEIWMLSAVMAHNLSHEIQMRSLKRTIMTSPKRACRYVFEKLGTLRHRLIQRAGRFTRPNGVLTLTMSGNKTVADEICALINAAAVAQ